MVDDPAASWLGLACTIVLQYDLNPSPTVVPLFATDDSSAYLAGAGETLTTMVDSRGNRVRLAAASFSLSTQRGTPLLDAELAGGAGGILEPLDRLAHQLDTTHAQSFPTRNVAALQAFVKAVATPDAAGRAQLLQTAVREDRRFGLAQIALAETVGAAALAGVDPGQFTPLDRARWQAVAARLRQEPRSAQIAAQQAILRLAPNNVDALATLGILHFVSGQKTEGEGDLRRAIGLSPGNIALQLQLRQMLSSAAPGAQNGR